MKWSTKQADNKYHPTLLRRQSPHILSLLRKFWRNEKKRVLNAEEMTAG